MEWNSSPAALLEVPPNALRRMRYLMGCFVEIEVRDCPDEIAVSAVEAAFSEMKRIERMLSRFDSESIVSRINRSAGRSPWVLSAEVFELMDQCLLFSELTEGAFDMTAAPLTELWHLAGRRQKLPSSNEIENVRSRVGYRHILLDKDHRTLFFSRPDMKIDLGAVGKGYAIDRAVAMLRSRGIEKGIVSTGSTIYAFGDEALRFGVRNPRHPQEIAATVMLQNNAVSTSALYEQYTTIGNKTYGHILDLQNGWPVQNEVLSVSLTGPWATECDMLSTALFILGQETGSKVLQKFKDVRAIFMTLKRFHPSPKISYFPNRNNSARIPL